jgi:hypothetical protein
VLFYGAPNSHRTSQIERLKVAGLNVHWHTDVHGEELHKWIQQSKMVVNIHYYQPSILELSRIVPALSCGAMVISEYSDDKDLDNLFREVVVFCKPDELVRTCLVWSMKTARELEQKRNEIKRMLQSNLTFEKFLKDSRAEEDWTIA